MSLAFDPEFTEAMRAWEHLTSTLEPVPLGDIETRRVQFEGALDQVVARLPMPGDVVMRDHEVVVDDGARLTLRWYTKGDHRPGSGVLFTHGGGMILNNIDQFDRPVARYVSESGVPFLSVEYRKAPEHPAPRPAEDCYAGLEWFAEHATELGVDPDRIAVMGDSAGGGLAASIAIMARDRGGPKIAQQVLLYPMLDDRNTVARPELEPFVSWGYIDNLTAWTALLGESVGGPGVSPHAAPARLQDASGLPPLYLDTGNLDIFLDENLAYVRTLAAAGVSTEVHVHPGVPHAWELFCPDIATSVRARQDRLRVLTSI
ncbi:MAG: alpha/beta hydrolase [Planctomycetota bacterium]